MISIFDIINNKPIENFRNAFFDVTGMSVSFADEEHKQYNTFYAGSRCEYCRVMNSSLQGLERCIKTSRDAGKKAAKSGEALIYTCHSGLKEVVVPIIINGKHIGSVFSGQVMTEAPSEKGFKGIRDCLFDLDIDSDEIRREYFKIPVVPSWQLDLVSRMLKIIVDYLIQTEINMALKEKISREKEKLREFIPYIKSQFVNYIITNNTEKLMGIKDKITYLGVKRVPNVVLYVKINDAEKLENEETEERINEKELVAGMISTELYRMRDVIVHYMDNDSIVIFVHINGDSQSGHKNEAILKIAERLRATVKEKTVFTAAIGISRPAKSLTGLSTAYREAFNAFTYGTIIGSDQIFHIDDIQKERNGTEQAFLDSEKIQQNVILANDQELISMYNNAFNLFLSDDCLALDRIKAYTLEFLNEVINSAIQQGLDDSYTAKKIEYFQKLMDFRTIQDIHVWVKSIINGIMTAIATGRTNKNKEIIKKVVNYIEENYGKELNLEDVAAVVYLSPNYFGWVFKKETGESFVEYLTRVRVAKAILLMESTEESIFSISEKVGYKDPNYFSQVFKKVEGIRPSAYRKMLAKGTK